MEGRVYGPPGTGKTTTMAARAARSVERYGAKRVTICSLTRAAVREASERRIPLPQGAITTLHARCKRSLEAGPPAEEYAAEFVSGHPPSLTSPECIPSSLYRRGPDERDSRWSGPSLYEQANILRQRLTPQAHWPDAVREWYQHWHDWCAETDRMDYTGWLEACRGGANLPEMEVVYVDEAQDHTPLQLSVLRSWPTEHVVMYGDDDQCLYAWAGAEPREFFAHEAEYERVLERSHRIPAPVHAVAQRLAGSLRERRKKEYFPAPHGGRVLASPRTVDDPELIRDLVGGSGSAMVLASCDYMLRPLIGDLRAAGVPFHNPYRATRAWNPLESMRNRLEPFMRRGRAGYEVERWASMLSTRAYRPQVRKAFLAKCLTLGVTLVPLSMMRAAFTDRAYAQIHRADTRMFLEAELPSAPPSWKYALAVLRSGADWTSPRVIVGTIHSVKGGEADRVFVSPDLSPAGFGEWRRTGDADPTLRMFYVAITRARRELTLLGSESWASVRWDEWIGDAE